MPSVVQFYWDIGVEKQRGVLFLVFKPEAFGEKEPDELSSLAEFFKALFESYDLEKCQARKDIIRFLEDNHIGWSRTYIDPHIMEGSTPHIYIDLPFDLENKKYQLLSQFLQDDDQGCTQFNGVEFYYSSLEQCHEYQEKYNLNNRLRNELGEEF